MAKRARKKVAKRTKKTAKKTAKHAKGPSARKQAAKKKKAAQDAHRTARQRPPHVGEDARIAIRREQVLLGTIGGASIRQIAAELGVSVGTVHEDLNA